MPYKRQKASTGHYKTRGGKKKTGGRSAELLSRGQAIRKLQISMQEFRRLCILKGVFPREASGNVKDKRKSYYLLKDIAFMSHDPLVEHLRHAATFDRKIARLLNRREPGAAAVLERTGKPEYSPDHLVRERYPTFAEALRAMDDALSMLATFARHQANEQASAEVARNCDRLMRQWDVFVARTRALRRCFVSIKGVYFQAEVMGQRITWITPHPFEVPEAKVDYTVMNPFVEFYQTLATFVMYKLYADSGMQYPPVLTPTQASRDDFRLSTVVVKGAGEEQAEAILKSRVPKAEGGAKGSAETELQKASKKRIASLAKVISKAEGEEEEEEEGDDDKEEEKKNGDEAEGKSDKEEEEGDLLFSRCRFYLGREVPQRSLELVILANGGKVGWCGQTSPYGEDDERITHFVTDREKIKRSEGRDYVQPQWVFDSVNERVMLPVAEYEPGKQAPPHLSPFVNDKRNGYVPQRREELNELRKWLRERKQAEDSEDSAEADKKKAAKKARRSGDVEMKEAEPEAIQEEEKKEETESADVDDVARYQAELEAESRGVPYAEAAKRVRKGASEAKKRKEDVRKRTEHGQEKQRAIAMLPNKQRRKYLRAVRQGDIKDSQNRQLKARRNPDVDAGRVRPQRRPAKKQKTQ